MLRNDKLGVSTEFGPYRAVSTFVYFLAQFIMIRKTHHWSDLWETYVFVGVIQEKDFDNIGSVQKLCHFTKLFTMKE